MNSSSNKEETFMPFVIGSGDASTPAPPAGGTDHGETTADFTQEPGFDPFSGISEKKRFKTGSLLLALVIVVACSGLWFMRSLSKAGAASPANKDVEASIEKFLSGLTGDTKSNKKPSSALASDANVLKVLNDSYVERQVPLDSVQRDPFVLPIEPTAGPNPGENDAALARRQSDRRKQMESAVARLELKSVLMGSNPLANVSGKIVRLGDEIVVTDGVALRVTEITKDAISVVGEDVSLNLSQTFSIVLKR